MIKSRRSGLNIKCCKLFLPSIDNKVLICLFSKTNFNSEISLQEIGEENGD